MNKSVSPTPLFFGEILKTKSPPSVRSALAKKKKKCEICEEIKVTYGVEDDLRLYLL